MRNRLKADALEVFEYNQLEMEKCLQTIIGQDFKTIPIPFWPSRARANGVNLNDNDEIVVGLKKIKEYWDKTKAKPQPSDPCL